MPDRNEERLIDQLVTRLAEVHPSIAPSTVAGIVRGEHARFDDRPLREYVPLLVERNATSELRQLVGARE